MQSYQLVSDGNGGDFNYAEPVDYVNFPDYSVAQSNAVSLSRFPRVGYGNVTTPSNDQDLWSIEVAAGDSITISLLPDLALPVGASTRELAPESVAIMTVYEYISVTTIDHGETASSYTLRAVDAPQKTDTLAVTLAHTNGWGLAFGEPLFQDAVLESHAGEIYHHSKNEILQFEETAVHTGLFVIAVNASANDFSAALPAGFESTQRDAGRYLLTTDNPTGQRAATWGTDWINPIDIVPAGDDDPVDPTVPEFIPPDTLLPLPSSDNSKQFESTHIDYQTTADGALIFTEERSAAFQGASQQFVTSLIGGVAGFFIKKAVKAAIPGVGPFLTAWDVYSAVEPLANVGFQSFLFRIGLNDHEPTRGEINRAFGLTFTNIAVELLSSGDEAFTGRTAREIIEAAGITTAGAIVFKETDSFTYSLFEPAAGQKGAIIVGGEKRDFALGSLFNDSIRGLAGSDEFFGMDGDDIIDGGAGADTLIGGTGNDTFVVDDAGDVVIEDASEGTDQVNSSVSFSLGGQYIERLTLIGSANIDGSGNSLANILTGNSGNNHLSGGSGADTMAGGAGNDTYRVDNVGDVVIEKNGEGTDQVNSSVSFSLGGQYIEGLNLTGSANINGTGNSLANVIYGNTGNNHLSGGSGADRMTGGSGNDTYKVDNAHDIVIEKNGEGTDQVNSSVSFSLGGQYIERLTLIGSANIDGSGNSLANILTGNSGNNHLSGGSGADTMAGGAGNDTYRVDNVGDVVIEKNGEGTDQVNSSVSFSLGGQYIEGLNLTGSANINGTGNSLANVIYGNTGNNNLNGGAGADTMTGGSGNDTYKVDNAGDIVIEKNGEGTDQVNSSVSFSLGGQYLEGLNLTGSANINGTGNSLDNILTGNSGNNILIGGFGKDTLTGGEGADTFLFRAALSASNIDTITDFNVAADTIRLDNAIFDNIVGSGILSLAQFAANSTGTARDADDRIIYETDTGKLFYDSNGSAAGGAVQFARLSAGLELTNADFVVV